MPKRREVSDVIALLAKHDVDCSLDIVMTANQMQLNWMWLIIKATFEGEARRSRDWTDSISPIDYMRYYYKEHLKNGIKMKIYRMNWSNSPAKSCINLHAKVDMNVC